MRCRSDQRPPLASKAMPAGAQQHFLRHRHRPRSPERHRRPGSTTSRSRGAQRARDVESRGMRWYRRWLVDCRRDHSPDVPGEPATVSQPYARPTAAEVSGPRGGTARAYVPSRSLGRPGGPTGEGHRTGLGDIIAAGVRGGRARAASGRTASGRSPAPTTTGGAPISAAAHRRPPSGKPERADRRPSGSPIRQRPPQRQRTRSDSRHLDQIRVPARIARPAAPAPARTRPFPAKSPSGIIHRK